MDAFKDRLEELISRLKENKMFVVCGDFNIDLLNVSKYKTTSDFLDALYSRGLYPLITKPSRITSDCSSFILIIFINFLENTVESGLLINDISDPLPVFAIFDCNIKKNKTVSCKRCFRIRIDEAIEQFRNYLINEEWTGVYVEEVNAAYD